MLSINKIAIRRSDLTNFKNNLDLYIIKHLNKTDCVIEKIIEYQLGGYIKTDNISQHIKSHKLMSLSEYNQFSKNEN